MAWPYFSTVSIVLQINDTPRCRSIAIPSIEITGTFLLRNLEKKGSESPYGDIQPVSVKVLFDMIPTPPRERRILID
jgi:hypothetical protein